MRIAVHRNILSSSAKAWILIAVFGATLPISAAVSDNRLLEAVQQQNHAAVRLLLAANVDPQTAGSDGSRPLHWAAHNDDLDTARLLVEAGANVSAVNDYGMTALALACINGSAAMIELLLQNGADPNAGLPEGETPLMTAARTGAVEPVAALLRSGADVNAREHWRGQTALMWAAAQGHAPVVRLLLASGADLATRSGGGFTALLFAVRAGHVESVHALLDAGAEVNQTAPDRRSLLVVAILNAHYEVAAYLLERGADPNANTPGYTSLHAAVQARNPQTVAMPNPVPTGRLDSLELVEALLAHGADPNAHISKPPEGVYTFLDLTGATPFLLAAQAVDVPLMRVLIKGGADPLLANSAQTTPLMAAAGIGYDEGRQTAWSESAALEAVKLAWEVGGRVNAADAAGNTALHGAALTGANSVVQFLVSEGAQLDVPNARGWTPLTIADGVRVGALLKSRPATAAFMRRLMANDGR